MSKLLALGQKPPDREGVSRLRKQRWWEGLLKAREEGFEPRQEEGVEPR